MANIYDQFDEAPQKPAETNIYDQFDQPEDPAHQRARGRAERSAGPVSQVVRGMPIIGPLAQKGAAAINAAIDPAFGDEGAHTFGERYGRNVDLAREADDKYLAEHPITARAENVAGGIAALGPVARTAVGARAMGITGNSIAGRTAASMASGAAVGGTDAALRGDDPIKGAIVSGTIGALAPAAGESVGRIINGVRGTTAAAEAPTVEALDSAARGSYDVARGVGLELDPHGIQTLALRLRGALHDDGFRPQAHSAPGSFGVLDELTNVPPGSRVTAADFESARRALGRVAGNHQAPTDQLAANRIREELDRYLENVPPADVLHGDPDAVSHALRDARGNYGAARRSERVTEAADRADLNAATSNSGANIDNATRQRMKALAVSPTQSRGFSPQELTQIEGVARGTPVGNTARSVGSILGGGGGLGALAAGGTGVAAAGPIGAAVPAIGYLAKQVGNRVTANGVRAVDDAVRMRSPLGVAAAQARDSAAATSQQTRHSIQLGSRSVQTPLDEHMRQAHQDMLSQITATIRGKDNQKH